MAARESPSLDTARAFLQPFDERWVEAAREASGLRPLRLSWAKCEIVLGLSAAAFGLRLLCLQTTAAAAWAGGALLVLGLYLAMAGHRSHLYLSLNRQTAYLLQMLEYTTQRYTDEI